MALQKGLLGNEFTGATETLLSTIKKRVRLMAIFLYCTMLLTLFVTARVTVSLALESQEIPIVFKITEVKTQIQKAQNGRNII